MTINNIIPMNINEEQVANGNHEHGNHEHGNHEQVANGNHEHPVLGNQINFDPIEYQRLVNTSKINRTEEQFEQYYYENINSFFEVWRRNISNLVFQEIGISLEDLPDFHYRSSFEEHVAAESMARHILDNIP